MAVEDVWPLFGLEIQSPRLLLRPARDDDFDALAQAAIDGIHDWPQTPFASPWNEAEPAQLRRNLATFHWRLRSQLSPARWHVPFVVEFEGQTVGSQDLSAHDFANRRTVETGSWLTKRVQGQGLGVEMRAALLSFAFDHLDAEWAESSAMSWNAASLGVSRKLGYQLNGVTRVSPKEGEPGDNQNVRLPKGDFIRPDWSIEVRGADAALAQLGIISSRFPESVQALVFGATSPGKPLH
ncbi:MAG: GNAT family N-acetyltransferase [Microbacterium sp.]